ncbi:MAG: hypothetical protein ABSF27_08060 [Candidatus Dormibacteria bacterium]
MLRLVPISGISPRATTGTATSTAFRDCTGLGPGSKQNRLS